MEKLGLGKGAAQTIIQPRFEHAFFKAMSKTVDAMLRRWE